MSMSKTQFVSYQGPTTNSTENTKLIYKFCQRVKYSLRDKTVRLLAKVNYDDWKKSFWLRIIDISWNSSLIALTWFLWVQEWLFFKGVAITLFFILLTSYVEDFKKLFDKQR